MGTLLFKDMFSFPQPATGESGETLADGCPLVHVSDHPRDFAIMLRIIYEGFTYVSLSLGLSKWTLLDVAFLPRYTRTIPAWPTVRAMVMLGTKYQADELRNEGILQLERAYPKYRSIMRHRTRDHLHGLLVHLGQHLYRQHHSIIGAR